jgi:hypothetical protein
MDKKIIFPKREMRQHLTIRIPRSDKEFIAMLSKKNKVTQTAVIEAALKLLRESYAKVN